MAEAATVEMRRAIHNKFATKLDVHPITFSIASELYREGDTPLTVVASWWIAIKFEECDAVLTVDHLRRMFPTVVSARQRAVELRLAEREVLARQNFCIPYKTRMREIYQLLPPNGAGKYHEWLVALQEYRVIYRFNAPYLVHLLAIALTRTVGLPPALQIMTHLLRRCQRTRLCPNTPLLGLKRGSAVTTTVGRKRRCVLLTIRWIDPFE